MLGDNTANLPKDLNTGSSFNFVINDNDTNCKIDNLTAGQKIESNIQLNWYSKNSGPEFIHTALGSLTTDVE